MRMHQICSLGVASHHWSDEAAHLRVNIESKKWIDQNVLTVTAGEEKLNHLTSYVARDFTTAREVKQLKRENAIKLTLEPNHCKQSSYSWSTYPNKLEQSFHDFHDNNLPTNLLLLQRRLFSRIPWWKGKLTLFPDSPLTTMNILL